MVALSLYLANRFYTISWKHNTLRETQLLFLEALIERKEEEEREREERVRERKRKSERKKKIERKREEEEERERAPCIHVKLS